jgi:leucyl aminopeptidase
MTTPITLSFIETDLDALAEARGKIAVIVPPEGKLDPAGRRLNRLTKGAIARLAEAEHFEKAKVGDVIALAFPAGLEAEALLVCKLPRRASTDEARKTGAALAKARGKGALTVCAGSTTRVAELGLGLVLRDYAFSDHKTGDQTPAEDATLMVSKPGEAAEDWADLAPLADGVFFTRDLVNEPSNVLTTTDFAKRLEGLIDQGVEVEVLEEVDLEKLGMRTLLAVGMGSESPSKVVVMQWNGGGDEAAAGAHRQGCGLRHRRHQPQARRRHGRHDHGHGRRRHRRGCHEGVAGRKAKANVVGIVGLVENMPDGRAQRPATWCLHEGRHGRGHQHRCRGPPRPVRRHVVRAGTVQARGHDRPRHADRGHHHRPRP